jgi:alpha-beta hydrolase superfamily lysophospholipase
MSKWLKGTIVAIAALAAVAALAAFAGARPSVGDCQGNATAAGARTWSVRAADGNCLQAYEWKPAAAPVRAAIVLVHGIHDHPGRYATLAQSLVAKGIAVYAYDQRGHGASGGARQRADSAVQLIGDAERVLAEATQRNPGAPLFLYGHSMGGLVAAHVAALDAAKPSLAGVVLSSAALVLPASASGGALVVVSILSRLAPGLGLEAVDEAQIVRDAAARTELARDPAILRDKVPVRTVDTILDGVVALQPLMPTIAVPLLILHGGGDRVTPPEGSRALAQRAGSKDKKLVVYDPALHSLLHEPEGPAVLDEIVAFVDARAGRP